VSVCPRSTRAAWPTAEDGVGQRTGALRLAAQDSVVPSLAPGPACQFHRSTPSSRMSAPTLWISFLGYNGGGGVAAWVGGWTDALRLNPAEVRPNLGLLGWRTFSRCGLHSRL